MKILVAEDDLVSTRMLSFALAKMGHEVICTANGREAFARFQADPPPIVISDWMMPEMDGVELCQKIRGLGLEQYTFFILLTAKSGHTSYLEAMQAGVDDFLAKPVSPEELRIRLGVAERIIRQRAQAERQIRDLARFPADNPNPVLQVNRDFVIGYANEASIPLLAHWESHVGGTAPQKLRQLVELLFRTGARQEIEMVCADRIFSFSATSASDDGQTYLYGHDITDRKKAEQELLLLKNQAEESALHDQLTGLPNRRLLTDRLHQEAARSAREAKKFALIMVDIDNFKQINDGYGHQLGDQVIVEVSHALRDALRATDTVCRWGGDELVLLLPDIKDRANLTTVCQKVLPAVKARAIAAGISAPVALSLGSAIFPDDAHDVTLLMQQADHALYTAKADGRDCWREFKGFPNNHDAKGKADVFIRLSAAVAEQRITAFFQPIIDTATLRVVGAEALARWFDEHYQWVSPDLFIPLAEEKGLIFKLGQQVLEQSLDQLADWRRRGHDLTVSVNLSKRQVLDGDFRASLIDQVARRNLRPESVILEVTERQSLLGHALGRQRLEDLAAAGFRLSMDDFGSGYSSFDLMGEMPFQELKVHIGLVRKIRTPKGRRIVQAIAEMGKTLGLRLVAEGVEDADMQAALLEIGVHKLQGYLFAKPLPANAFLEFVEARHASLDRAA